MIHAKIREVTLVCDGPCEHEDATHKTIDYSVYNEALDTWYEDVRSEPVCDSCGAIFNVDLQEWLDGR